MRSSAAAACEEAAKILMTGATDVVLLGTGGSSLGVQALAQLAGYKVSGIIPFRLNNHTLRRNEFARMQKDGPTRKELEEAIAYLTGAYALRFDTNSKIAGQLLGTMIVRSGIDYIRKRNDMIRAVTLEKAKQVARRLLHPDQLTFTIIGKPKGIKTTTN